jgi:3-oxoadipate enol-lactonase / 4-carboxymuconolactone decarboxylase
MITLSRLSTAAPGRPVLVLGPSIGTTAATLWGRCAALLADRFDVWGFDLPGHGRSPVPAGPYTIADLARAVLAGVDGPFHYAGDSIGGAVGLTLLLADPGRIRSATLACTGAVIGDPATWAERAALVRRDGMTAVLESSARRWFAPGFLDREPAAGGALLDALAGTDVEGYARACEALAAYDVRDRLGGVRGPLTLIGGRYDVATPLDGLREIAAAVDGATLVELPIAHQAPVEDPATTAALIAAGRPGPGDTRAAGMAVRREVAGDAWVDRAVAGTTGFTRDFQDLITRYAWGELWTRPGLDRRSRSMITLTALIARGHHEELALHVRAALTNGLTRDEIKEVLLNAAVYCGVPDANTAFRVAAEVFADLDRGPG